MKKAFNLGTPPPKTPKKRNRKLEDDSDWVSPLSLSSSSSIDDLVNILDGDLDALTRQYKCIKDCGDSQIVMRYKARIYNRLIETDPTNVTTVQAQLQALGYDPDDLAAATVKEIGYEAARLYRQLTGKPPIHVVRGEYIVNGYSYSDAKRCIIPAIKKYLSSD
jgi:hypothetical protein